MKFTNDGSGAFGFWVKPGIKHLTIWGLLGRLTIGYVAGATMWKFFEHVVLKDITR